MAKFSQQHQIIFSKQLAILLKSGMPIARALDSLRARAAKKQQLFISNVWSRVENGQPLYAALAAERMFADFGISIIKIGELSGTLAQNLHYLADELKKQQQMKKKILNALLYPCCIVVATCGISGLLTVYIFPKILPVFQDLHFQLPLSTRILIAISNLLLHHWVWLVGAILFLVAGGVVLSRIPYIQFWVDRQLLQLPLIGTLLKAYYLANCCRTLGLLLQSRSRIVEAVQLTARTCPNLAYLLYWRQSASRLARGETVTQVLGQQPQLFPTLLVQILAVGEQSGSLDASFLYLADLYEQEVEELSKNLSSLIEPVLMIVMGVIVGFVAISIITPIYQITQNLHP